MSDLFKILERLADLKIAFCFQCQGEVEYFMMMVENPLGNKEYFNFEKIEDVEKRLKIMWGHVLNDKKPKTMPVPVMPMP